MSPDERSTTMIDEMSPEADGSPASADTGPSADEDAREARRATGLAIAAAGISIVGFVSLFRLRVRWDGSQSRAFRRFFGVQVESLTGIAVGYQALNRLRRESSDKRGVPFPSSRSSSGPRTWRARSCGCARIARSSEALKL